MGAQGGNLHPAETVNVHGIPNTAVLETASGAQAKADAAQAVSAQKSANLGDLASASTARTNLGLGDAATKNTGTAAGTLAAGNDARFTTIPTTTQATSYTLVLADAGTAVEVTASGATNVTVPPNSSVAYPVGTVVEVVQYGTGQVTLVAGSGVTLRTSSSLTARAQYSAVTLRKRATNEWLVGGDTT